MLFAGIFLPLLMPIIIIGIVASFMFRGLSGGTIYRRTIYPGSSEEEPLFRQNQGTDDPFGYDHSGQSSDYQRSGEDLYQGRKPQGRSYQSTTYGTSGNQSKTFYQEHSQGSRQNQSYYEEEPNSTSQPGYNVPKSVTDEEFWMQDHPVVDVDYQEEDN